MKQESSITIRSIFFTLLTTGAIATSSQLFGQDIQESLDDFHTINFKVGGALTLINSGTPAIDAQLVRGDRKDLEISVRDGILTIQRKAKRFPWFNRNRIEIQGEISYVALKQVSTYGSGDITAELLNDSIRELEIFGTGTIDVGKTSTKNLNLSVFGSGDIRLRDVTVHSIETAIHGSGDVLIHHGQAETQETEIYGSGKLNSPGFSAVASSVSIYGSGNVHVSPIDTLNVGIFGSGNVVYENSPTTVNSQIRGSGSVTQN